MKRASIVVLLACVCACSSITQAQKAPEGIWQGYDGEWLHVSKQLIDLAEATPADKFAWRPAKADVISWLKRSLDAVKGARAALKPGDLEHKVHIMDRDATVDGMYLRIIIHANEHMGQLVAYARMTGVTPPWSAN